MGNSQQAQDIKYRPEKTVVFATTKSNKLGNTDSKHLDLIVLRIREELLKSIRRGKTVFMATDLKAFCLLCLREVINLKADFPFIKVGCYKFNNYRPFYFNDFETDLYDSVINKLDLDYTYKHENIRPKDKSCSYDQFLMQSCSELICFFSIYHAATTKICQYAREYGVTITNLYDDYKQITKIGSYLSAEDLKEYNTLTQFLIRRVFTDYKFSVQNELFENKRFKELQHNKLDIVKEIGENYEHLQKRQIIQRVSQLERIHEDLLICVASFFYMQGIKQSKTVSLQNEKRS